MLKFDTETAGILNNAYAGADIIRRRRASYDALQVAPGDTIADIGCGNGLLSAELARGVGSTGQVIGVEPSEEMRKAGQAHCAEFENVILKKGLADDLPIEDGSVHKAVSLQVFEYLSDIPAALAEARRVLRPAGRLVLGDMHFGTFAWASDNPERMARMMRSWNDHVSDPACPEKLPSQLEQAGFTLESVTAVPFIDHVLKPDGFALMTMILMERFAVAKGHVSAEDARAWADEQRRLAKEGRFFFSLTHFVISATA